VAGQEATARLSADIKPALGDRMMLSVDPERLHLFDRGTTKRLN
jgi:hypothetical protein